MITTAIPTAAVTLMTTMMIMRMVEDDMRRFELSAQGSARKHRHEV